MKKLVLLILMILGDRIIAQNDCFSHCAERSGSAKHTLPGHSDKTQPGEFYNGVKTLFDANLAK